ncbi:bzip transcription factor [Ophiostoma piceae UAMH 11346]|uniref:Bzip transcription factor n=1 Tax=Ophiostoma piceae (strain UAMH 11346) TaxID=1262450 RepID=S3BVS7_OPHP1|nr:bzip transcription factor [Ophiostoma piceae UAMH 11346]
MDFSHQFFAGNHQPFQQQFIGIPPLTPSHSNSAASDDYTTTSPPEGFHDFTSEHFPSFDSYGVQFAPQQHQHQQQQPQPQAVFPGPPTPPGQHQLPRGGVHAAQQSQPQTQPPVTAAVGQPLSNGSAMVIDQQAGPDILSVTKTEPGMDDFQHDQNQRAGSNSDDEEMTPAQSRRKAQNRAAQRAFRERKERHVKDLEAKLASLEATQHNTATENEKLKRDLQKVHTENEILRATSSLQAAAAAAGASPGSDGVGGSNVLTAGPMTYNPTDFYTDLLANHEVKTPSHRIAKSDTGDRLLGAGATWDLIIGHESFKRGLVDVADISNRLKSQAKCDGQGPVFEERAILEAIEQSVGSGSDSLI